MSIWNKILLGCIFVTGLLLFVLSARAMQAHRIWQESFNKHQEAIAAAEAKTKELLGTLGQESDGLLSKKQELYELLIGRGRVWDNCQAVKVEVAPNTPPRITLAPSQPIEANSVVYAFEQKPLEDGAGAYLGQFTVTKVGSDQQVMVEPSIRLSKAEVARVDASAKAQIPWRLYELMPTDDHDVLKELTPEQIQALFPNKETFGDAKYASVDDYLKDGEVLMKEEAESQGLDGTVVMVDEAGNPIREESGERQGLYKEVEDGKGKFVRKLTDYELLFNEGHRIRSMTEDRIRVVKRDFQFLQDSLADFRDQRAMRQKEIQDLEQELAETSKERDAVVAHEAKLDGAIASMKRAIADLIERNEATIAEVGKYQSEAARIINERTASVVQASGR